MHAAPYRTFFLPSGHQVFIDLADWPVVSQRGWHINEGYACTRINGVRHYLSRMLLGLPTGDKRRADHISRDRLDNRRSNLRIITHAQNCQNVSKMKGTSSKYRGVCWHKQCQKWLAHGKVNGKQFSLGLYHDEEEAGAVAEDFRKQNLPYAID